MKKTNVMRILDKYKIKYQKYTYDSSNAISSVEVAKTLNQNQKNLIIRKPLSNYISRYIIHLQC